MGVVENLDAYTLSNYIETKASVMSGHQDGIQRSASEASLFFRHTSPEQLHKLARFPHSQRSALKSSIRRGLMMLPGNILLMRAAQSDRKQQIRFGVKSSVGHRPYMEDSHIMKPFFFRFPISLACNRQLIPDFVQTELDKVKQDSQIEDSCPWSAFQTEMPSSKDGSVQCVFDEFDLFLICDGHGGAQVSQYCTANFKKILKKQLKTSVEERYLELLQTAQKSGHESEGAPSSLMDGLPERSVKSAVNLGERSHHHSSPLPPFKKGGARRLKISESVRERGTGKLTDTANHSSKKGPPSAQCGLDVDHLRDCLFRSFQQLDAEVKEQKLGDFEGSTALAALVGSWHICVANCGILCFP